MKLNYRDKMILIVVFVLLIIVAGFMLFIKPAIDECSQASSDLESAKVQLSELTFSSWCHILCVIYSHRCMELVDKITV